MEEVKGEKRTENREGDPAACTPSLRYEVQGGEGDPLLVLLRFATKSKGVKAIPLLELN